MSSLATPPAPPPLNGSSESLTTEADPRDRRLALGVGGGLVAAFVATAPFARSPWPAMPAFIPAYDTAIVVLHAITAWLLYAHYRQGHGRALLALVCGYAGAPIVVAAHSLSFPDAFVPGSLIGGEQTAAWLRVGWQGLLPVYVAGYAYLTRVDSARSRAVVDERTRADIALTALAASAGLALCIVALATAGAHLLPTLISGYRYLPFTGWVLLAGWLAHLGALVLLVWGTRLQRVLDLWLALAMVALLIDLALSAVFVTARFQAGYYLGRAYGLLGTAFVLGVLLAESVAALARAAAATALARETEMRRVADLQTSEAALRRAHADLEARVEERTAALAAEIGERRAAETRIKALLGRVMSVQEEERRRIARDIHDQLGQQITALRMALESLGATSAAPPAAGVERASHIAEELDKSIDALTREMRPIALDHLGLIAALENLVRTWSERFGVPVEFESSVPDRLRLSPDAEANLYRIAQEGLHNIYKHARASLVQVTFAHVDGEMQLVIKDDGRGFSPVEVHDTSVGGLGLESMHERAALIGGQLIVRSVWGHGTTLTVRVPAASATL